MNSENLSIQEQLMEPEFTTLISSSIADSVIDRIQDRVFGQSDALDAVREQIPSTDEIKDLVVSSTNSFSFSSLGNFNDSFCNLEGKSLGEICDEVVEWISSVRESVGKIDLGLDEIVERVQDDFQFSGQFKQPEFGLNSTIELDALQDFANSFSSFTQIKLPGSHVIDLTSTADPLINLANLIEFIASRINWSNEDILELEKIKFQLKLLSNASNMFQGSLPLEIGLGGSGGAAALLQGAIKIELSPVNLGGAIFGTIAAILQNAIDTCDFVIAIINLSDLTDSPGAELSIVAQAESEHLSPEESTRVKAVVEHENEPVEGKTVRFSASQGELSSTSSTTNSDGEAFVDYKAPKDLEDDQISVLVETGVKGKSDSIEITVERPIKTNVQVSAEDRELVSGQSTEVTATVTRDDEPMTGESVSFSASAGDIDNQSTTNSDGETQVTYTAPSDIEGDQISVTIEANVDDESGSTTVTVDGQLVP